MRATHHVTYHVSRDLSVILYWLPSRHEAAWFHRSTRDLQVVRIYFLFSNIQWHNYGPARLAAAGPRQKGQNRGPFSSHMGQDGKLARNLKLCQLWHLRWRGKTDAWRWRTVGGVYAGWHQRRGRSGRVNERAVLRDKNGWVVLCVVGCVMWTRLFIAAQLNDDDDDHWKAKKHRDMSDTIRYRVTRRVL